MTQLAGHPSTAVPTLDPEPVGHVDLAVVGAGAAATLLMAQLERRWVGDLPRTAVIEKERCLGPGVAYRTDDTRHRMNVRSCQLTAFPEEPDHFLTWVRERDPAAGPDDYVPRALFGRYLREVLERATADQARVTRIRADVTSVLHGPPWPAPKEPKEFGGDGVLLVGRDGPVVRADHVVLAVGVPPTGPRRFAVDPEVEASGRYVDDPWSGTGLQAAAGADRVVLVGTGLTMVDVALSLLDGHDGREVVAISTTGRLPEAHQTVRTPATLPVGRPDEATARGVVRWLRELCAEEPAGWQAAVDAVRWASPDIWAALPVGEQARLLRMTGSRWSRHRHRMPPAVAAEIEAVRRGGRLCLRAGRVHGIGPGTGGVAVRVRRPTGGHLVLEADAVVNCSGPPGIWSTTHPVVRELVDTGTVGVGAHGLGLAVADDGAVLDPAGIPLPQLSVLGALRRGTEFEATAVPELRAQAERLVPRLARSVARHR
jgi:uncharacterized NAD(P)/FAD-binding protein YdhS